MVNSKSDLDDAKLKRQACLMQASQGPTSAPECKWCDLMEGFFSFS